MGCQSEVQLERPLTFSVCTHDSDTGVLTDADAVPIYRVYEDETLVPLLIGNMAALDPLNTTGFYTAQIQCTAVNGFEHNRSYTIYIQATVLGNTGGIPYGFRVLECTCMPGPGATQVIYVLTNDDTGLPISDADIWVTTDIGGLNVVASGRTNAIGHVTFWLDSGVTYYVWRQRDGYVFVNPDIEVVP